MSHQQTSHLTSHAGAYGFGLTSYETATYNSANMSRDGSEADAVCHTSLVYARPARLKRVWRLPLARLNGLPVTMDHGPGATPLCALPRTVAL